jgi:hypothetical protein
MIDRETAKLLVELLTGLADAGFAVTIIRVPGSPREREGSSQEPENASKAAKPAKASRDCAGDVLAMLQQRGRRMTGLQLVEAFADGQEWSRSTVEATCSWLVRQGKLDSRRDNRGGGGYGLPAWQDEQQAAEEDTSRA